MAAKTSVSLREQLVGIEYSSRGGTRAWMTGVLGVLGVLGVGVLGVYGGEAEIAVGMHTITA